MSWWNHLNTFIRWHYSKGIWRVREMAQLANLRHTSMRIWVHSSCMHVKRLSWTACVYDPIFGQAAPINQLTPSYVWETISKIRLIAICGNSIHLWPAHMHTYTNMYIHHTYHHIHTENVKLERRFLEWLSHIITFFLFFCAWRLVQVLPGHRSICDQWFTHLLSWLTWDTWDITLDMKNPKKKTIKNVFN